MNRKHLSIWAVAAFALSASLAVAQDVKIRHVSDQAGALDAVGNAVATGKSGGSIPTLAQDYACGRDGIKAFKEALATTGPQIVHEEYAPQQTTDFTAPAERLFNALKDRPGRKVIFILWAG